MIAATIGNSFPATHPASVSSKDGERVGAKTPDDSVTIDLKTRQQTVYSPNDLGLQAIARADLSDIWESIAEDTRALVAGSARSGVRYRGVRQPILTL
jgi:hypothetical protein